MARPRKPPIGTAHRLQMDIADYGKTWRFIRDYIKAAGDSRGVRHRAIAKAAKEFDINYKTAERHYERIRKFDTPEGLSLLAGGLIKKWAPAVDEAMGGVNAAFSPDEVEQLASVGSDLVLRLARERLELIELRKRRKNK